MGELSINTTTLSDMANRVANIAVDSKELDSATGQDETEYQNSNWTQYWGYFNEIAELKSAILMKATWNVGKGWTADPETTVILDHIAGWGKDTFDDVIFNMEAIRRINGDAYAEIIRADDGTLINLKPLDPGSMKIIVDKKGIIKRYEQTTKAEKGVIKFKPEEIFHLSHNRLADQIHGVSDILSLEKTILAENESFQDLRRIMHTQAKPIIMFKLGTDDQAKINLFVSKMDAAVNKGENIYIPDDKNTVDYEVIQVNISQLVLEWRNAINQKFYRALGLPLIIFGGSTGTESQSKIEYLAHEQVFEKDQRYLELQIWNQLNLRINLIPPVSLLENLQTDQNKDAAQGVNFKPSDVTAGVQ